MNGEIAETNMNHALRVLEHVLQISATSALKGNSA